MMNKENNSNSGEKSNKKNNKGSESKDDTNTIHSQNEEIKEGKVEVNDEEKK